MASGEMTDAQFQSFLAMPCDQIRTAVCDGAIAFVCMDWRHSLPLLQAASAFELKNICVWVKNNGGMGSLYRSQHEFVFVYKFGAANHINNVELGKHGRYRTNVGNTVASIASVPVATSCCEPILQSSLGPGRRHNQGLLQRGDLILDPLVVPGPHYCG